MLFTTTMAALGFASYAGAHMIMSTPVPYGKSSLNNSPLDASGSDFPCKLRSNTYDTEGASNPMTLGSTQPLSFIGSATHGGGSCQISITYDKTPSASSTFKVIHSIEGGCPIKGVAGNNGDNKDAVDPDTYHFTVPTDIPTGNATLAWTWFNKVGNREMYMNCAPVYLTSGSSKRDEVLEARDSTAYDALPNMFVANIGNGCGTVDSTDVLFPDPGNSVEQDGLATSSALSTPTGSACGSAVAASVSATAGSDDGSPTAIVTSAPAAAAATTGSAPVVTSAPGGVFATVVASVASIPTSAAPSSAASAAPPAESSSPSGTSSVKTAGSSCSDEGEWNCINSTSYQRCASGQWTVEMSLAAGTTCTSGLAANIDIVATKKRNIRFSSGHLRRHLQHSQ